MLALSISKNLDTSVSGFKVLSDAYSYPSFKILILFILPITSDSGTIYAFFPLVDITFLKIGRDLKLDPDDITLSLLIPPEAEDEGVVYFNSLHSIWLYDDFSGTL